MRQLPLGQILYRAVFHRAGREGRRAGQRLEDHTSQGIQIGLGRNLLPAGDLLRRHVGHGVARAAHRGDAAGAGAILAAQAGDLDLPGVGYQNLIGRQLPVQRVALMGVFQAVADLQGVIDHGVPRQTSAVAKDFGQRFAMRQFRGQEGLALEHAAAVAQNQVGVLQRLEELQLAGEVG